jgi:hypothetical protein
MWLYTSNIFLRKIEGRNLVEGNIVLSNIILNLMALPN